MYPEQLAKVQQKKEETGEFPEGLYQDIVDENIEVSSKPEIQHENKNRAEQLDEMWELKKKILINNWVNEAISVLETEEMKERTKRSAHDAQKDAFEKYVGIADDFYESGTSDFIESEILDAAYLQNQKRDEIAELEEAKDEWDPKIRQDIERLHELEKIGKLDKDVVSDVEAGAEDLKKPSVDLLRRLDDLKQELADAAKRYDDFDTYKDMMRPSFPALLSQEELLDILGTGLTHVQFQIIFPALVDKFNANKVATASRLVAHYEGKASFQGIGVLGVMGTTMSGLEISSLVYPGEPCVVATDKKTGKQKPTKTPKFDTLFYHYADGSTKPFDDAFGHYAKVAPNDPNEPYIPAGTIIQRGCIPKRNKDGSAKYKISKHSGLPYLEKAPGTQFYYRLIDPSQSTHYSKEDIVLTLPNGNTGVWDTSIFDGHEGLDITNITVESESEPADGVEAPSAKLDKELIVEKQAINEVDTSRPVISASELDKEEQELAKFEEQIRREEEDKRRKIDEDNAYAIEAAIKAQEIQENQENQENQESEPKGLEGLKGKIVASLEESLRDLEKIPKPDTDISGSEIGMIIPRFAGTSLGKTLHESHKYAGKAFPLSTEKDFDLNKMTQTLAEWKALEYSKEYSGFIQASKKNAKYYKDYVAVVVDEYLDNYSK